MTKWREEKQRYQQYKARKEQLPASYQGTVDAMEHYATRVGPSTGEALVPMLEDLVALFEKAAVDETPVRSVVGEDPVRFADEFLQRYPASGWLEAERQRLTTAVDRAAGE